MPKTKKLSQNNKYYYNYFNPRLLNINTILKINNPDTNVNNIHEIENSNSDIVSINNIFNNNNNSINAENIGNVINAGNVENIGNTYNKYNIVKYLGEGIQGSLYLANDSNKKRFICKKITINNNAGNNANNANNENENTNNSIDNNQIKQLEFELNILKYLSSNKVTKDYINPCLEYKIVDNNIFTIFPIFNGYSLNHLANYLLKLDNTSYYKIIFHLIKIILNGMANIHKSKIAHQNINNNSILVSTYTKPGEIYIKFTDFGLGCGNSSNSSKNNPLFKYNTCRISNFTPVSITDNIIEDLSDKDHLFIAQRYDLLCLGILFIKLHENYTI